MNPCKMFSSYNTYVCENTCLHTDHMRGSNNSNSRFFQQQAILSISLPTYSEALRNKTNKNQLLGKKETAAEWSSTCLSLPDIDLWLFLLS